MTRLSLDMDRPATERDALQAAATIERITGAVARVYRTRSGGHHVETDTISGLSVADSLTLRALLGDDMARLRRDLKRISEGRAYDFLFNRKRDTQRVRLL